MWSGCATCIFRAGSPPTGMGVDKIAAFYDDAVKQACDAFSAAKAYYLRSLSTEAGLSWRARRWGKI